jgi:hypothetical protein
VLIDLHTHSNASDGTDSPADLVRLAVKKRLDVVAITDHDSADGWAAAVEAAERHRITLVRGMEISTKYEGEGVHLLAYLPDPTYEPLVAELDLVLQGRDGRLAGIVERLRDVGVELSEDEVRRQVANSPAVGRPHIAAVMVAKGIVTSVDEAFEKYLNQGRPGYVARYATPTRTMIELVTAAGGAAVVAHPWRRSRVVDGDVLQEFVDAGLAGIEVDHQNHNDDARATLRALADDLGLIATGSSDYHGTSKLNHELGCNTTPVAAYEGLLSRAATNAQAAGRDVPAVVQS